MADATGSSAAAGADAPASHDGLDKFITQGQNQAFLMLRTKIAPNIPRQIPQYPIRQIPASMRMPMLASHTLSAPQIAAPPQQIARPPQQVARPLRHPIQSQPPLVAGQRHQASLRHHQQSGSYQPQDNSISNTTSSTSPLGFADWRMYNDAIVSSAQTTTPFGGGGGGINNCNISSHGFHQNSSAYSTNIWTNYVPRKEKDLGFATSFGATAPVVSVSPFELMSQRPTNYSSAQMFQKVKNLDGVSWAFVSREIEGSDASYESDFAPELDSDGDTDDMNFVLNCKYYNTILCKELTNSDCGSMGRIVLPKRDAEANLPALVEKDVMILEMHDFELPRVWKFKYRYWPNNRSRMYILETAGGFVKRHDLHAGDLLIIYNHKRTGRHVVRAVKAIRLNSAGNMMECQCIKAGNSVEECGFAIRTKKKYDI